MKSTRKIQSAPILSGYAPLLAGLKARVRAAQVKAALSVNRELILLYWHIGREILRAQRAEGWGSKVVERLAKDLAAELPEMGGFSSLNLKRMRSFYVAWVPAIILQQLVAQLTASIVPRLVGQLRKPFVKQAVSKLVSQPVTQFDPGSLSEVTRLISYRIFNARSSSVVL